MTQFVIANNVNTQLAAAAASGATTLTLASSANLPTLSAGQIMPLTLNDAATGQSYEIVYVTAISGVTLTVTRAQEGTGALNWSIGDYAYCAPTAGTVAMTTGNPSDTFQVAAATALNNAPQAGQVQRAAFNYASAAGGTANALTATLTPAPASYTDDLVVVVRVASANTGATTLNVNSLGATDVVGAGHQPLQGGELAANGFACFAYSQSLTQFVLVWSTGGAEQVGAATQSQHALQLGQAVGRLLNVQIFTSSGMYTPTSGMTKAIVEVQGAGAGTGGAPATGSGAFSGSPGASSGSYAKCLLTAAQVGASQTVTIGAAGAAGSGVSFPSTGGNGGTSSFGSLISCPGGVGSSSYGPTGNTVFMTQGAGLATAPTTSGTVLISTSGNYGGPAIGSAAGGVLGGTGGQSPINGGATGPGAGAFGTALGASASAVAGNAGTVGKVIVWEYA